LHDDPKIKAWWSNRQLAADFVGIEEQCLVTGEVARICRIHPDIKGFKSSVALVGIQENTSYESYGRSKAENCPISEEVAFRYATALNALLDGPQKSKHRININGTTAIFWTERPTIIEDCLAGIFTGGLPAADQFQDVAKRLQIQRLLQAVRSGKKFQEFGEPETPFYILGLEQPNPGRFSIRFFHRSTVAGLLAQLHDHQKSFEIVRQYTEQNGSLKPDPEFPSIMDILRQTPPPKGNWPDDEKISPLLSGALTRAIVEGTPYPEGLFSAIIRRIQSDRTINYLRAATIKAVLVRNHHQTIPIMLDTESTDPAYLLGRLFSTLEKTQEDALGNVNAGIRDRFYSAASATPASVFPRLLRTYQHWLSKLNGGAKVNRERLVQEIMASIGSSGFPNQFPLKKQGIFAIGYYHQRKDFFTKKEAPSSTETESAPV
jgi:CRISPR-associated protein Csd1